MSTSQQPAFPLPLDRKPGDRSGLTKREYAAIHIAAAIIAAPDSGDCSFHNIAERAWTQADVLLTALEQSS